MKATLTPACTRWAGATSASRSDIRPTCSRRPGDRSECGRAFAGSRSDRCRPSRPCRPSRARVPRRSRRRRWSCSAGSWMPTPVPRGGCCGPGPRTSAGPQRRCGTSMRTQASRSRSRSWRSVPGSPGSISSARSGRRSARPRTSRSSPRDCGEQRGSCSRPAFRSRRWRSKPGSAICPTSSAPSGRRRSAPRGPSGSGTSREPEGERDREPFLNRRSRSGSRARSHARKKIHRPGTIVAAPRPCAWYGSRPGGPGAGTRDELFGNTEGLKASQSKRLLATYRRRVQQRELCSPELARHLTELSRETGRQLGVLLNRRGEVEWVIVGNAQQIELPDIGRARAGASRLRGLRLVHTHLKGEPLTRDDLTDLVLLRLDAVPAIAARDDGLPGRIDLATLLPFNEGGELYRQDSAATVQDLDFDAVAHTEGLEAEMARAAPVREVGVEGRAILVGVFTSDGGAGLARDGRRPQAGADGGGPGLARDGRRPQAGAYGRRAAEDSLQELRELARTAGVDVLDVILQGRREIDPRTVVGGGKLQEILVRSMALGADLLVFDRNLQPSQARHIAEATSLKIIDRTQLILDIFAQRAQSADGKLQVELAQLKYRLPRLVGRDDSLSRLAGGIGGRGPGETKLEVDRRRVRDRITHLEDRIDRLSSDRATRRRQRNRAGVPVVSIVGYTNAGKSTLLNSLTDSEVRAENKLFATLDPTSRRLRFPRDREVIITDTVGFIRDLPRDLVTAFRATLEELEEADLLLHVVDASDPRNEEQARAVERVLSTLPVNGTPRLLVYNKLDLAPDAARALAHRNGGVAVSATTSEGFADLLARVEDVLWKRGKVQAPGAVPEFLPTRHG